LSVLAEPALAAATLLLFHLYPALVVVGNPLKPRDLARVTLLRSPLFALRWVAGALGRSQRSATLAENREWYTRNHARVDGDFFEQRATACPQCRSDDL